MVVESNVSGEHAGGQKKSGWVGLVFTLNIKTDVSATWLENSDIATHVASRNDTWTTNKTSADVRENTTVQVWHDHDIELLWTADTLHRGVVDNHVVGLNGWVLLSDSLDGVSEETVGKLHDVGLVNASDLLAVVGEGECESELGDTLRLHAGDNLKGLDNTWCRRVLQARVFTFGILTDDAQVDIFVASLVARDVLDENNGGVDVEFLTESDVERLVTRALDRGVKDT